jgi:hypothetical protein
MNTGEPLSQFEHLSNVIASCLEFGPITAQAKAESLAR